MYTSLVAKIAVILLVLTSCSFKEVKPGYQSQYTVKQVNDLTHQDLKAENQWQTKVQRKHSLGLCFVDTLTGEKIIDESFRVLSPFGEKEIKTDHSGCGRYDFDSQVNLLTARKFIQMDLKVTRVSDEKDQSELELFLNPWSNQVVDGRYQSIDNAVKSDSVKEYVNASPGSSFSVEETLEDRNVGYNFGIDKIDLFADEDKVGVKNNIHFQFEARPWVKIMLEAGKDRKVFHEHGRLKARFLLLNNSDEVIGVSSSDHIVDIESGRVSIPEVDVLLWSRPAVHKDIELFIQLTPINNDDLTPWSGKVALNLMGLRSRVSREVQEVEADELADLFEEADSFRLIKDDNSENDGPEFVQFSRKGSSDAFVFAKEHNVTFVGLDAIPESAGMASARIHTSLCLANSMSERPLAEQNLRYRFSNDSLTTKSEWTQTQTDRNGCLNLNDSMEFSYWGKVSYISFASEFEFEGDENIYFLKGSVNPWLGSHKNFYWPDEYGTAPTLAGVGMPEFRLSQAKYEIPLQQEIFYANQYLNLRREEFFVLKLDPVVARKINGLDKNYNDIRSEKLWSGSSYSVDVIIAGHSPMIDERRLAKGLNVYRLISRFQSKVSADSQGEIHLAIPYSYTITERPIVEAGMKVFLKLNSNEGGLQPKESIFELHLDSLKEGVNVALLDNNSTEKFSWTELVDSLKPETHNWTNLELSARVKSEIEEHSSDFTFTKPMKNNQKSPFELFVERSDLRDIRIADLKNVDAFADDIDDLDLNTDEIEELLEGDLDLTSKVPREIAEFCKLMGSAPKFSETEYRKVSEYSTQNVDHEEQSCVRNPFKYINLDYFQFASPRSKSAMRKVDHSSTNFTVTNSYSIASTQSKRWDEGERDFTRKEAGARVDAGVKVEGGFKLLGNGGGAFASASAFGTVGVGNMKYTALTESHGLWARESVNTNENVVLHLQGRTFEADVDVKSCLLVTPASGDNRGVDKRVCGGAQCRGVMFCAESAKKIQESWYYLTDRSHGSFDNPRDKRAVYNRKWVMALRGQQRVGDLKKVLSGTDQNLVLVPQTFKNFSSDHLMSDMKKLELKIMEDQGVGVFPGLVNHTRVNGGEVQQLAKKKYEATPKNNTGRPNWKLYSLKQSETWKAVVTSISPQRVTIAVYKNQRKIDTYTLNYKNGSLPNTMHYIYGESTKFGRNLNFSYNEKLKNCSFSYKYKFAGSTQTSVNFRDLRCSHEDLSARK